MTIVLRKVGEAHWVNLKKAGRCRVTLTDILGYFGRGGPLRIVWL